MKHIRTYKQHLDEGLIKTYSLKEFVKHLNIMSKSKYPHIIKNAETSPDGHVYIIIDIKKPNSIEFVKSLIELINTLGYYIANTNFRGRNTDEETSHTPKNNEEFLSIAKEASETNGVEGLELSIEPKFEKEVTGKFTTLYHITEKKHLEKILKQGLVPRSKSKMSYHPERIYLANKRAISGIYRKYSEFVKDPILLIVDVKGLKLYPDINANDGAYFTTTNIDPERIKVMKTDPELLVNKYIKAHKSELDDEEFQRIMNNTISNLLSAHPEANVIRA